MIIGVLTRRANRKLILPLWVSQHAPAFFLPFFGGIEVNSKTLLLSKISFPNFFSSAAAAVAVRFSSKKDIIYIASCSRIPRKKRKTEFYVFLFTLFGNFSGAFLLPSVEKKYTQQKIMENRSGFTNSRSLETYKDFFFFRFRNSLAMSLKIDMNL